MPVVCEARDARFVRNTLGWCVAVATVTAAVVAAAAFAAGPGLFNGSAKALIPHRAGATITSQSVPKFSHPKPGMRSSWSATYSDGVSLLAAVFSSEAAAKNSYASNCGGCDTGTDPTGWHYKHAYDAASGTNPAVATVVGWCHNVVVAASDAHGAGIALTTAARDEANQVFARAIILGMSPCQTTSAIPPKTKVYWSENQAEAVITARLHVPNCDVFPDQENCDRQAPWRVSSAKCTGADERNGSFTYSRFSCDIEVDDGNGAPIAQGRIALYPTGTTTFVWKLL